MKRGLVEWDEQEVPRAALDARLERVRAWGRQRGLDALLFHTSDSHTQPVRYLTHFLLYWNEGVLVVPCAADAEPGQAARGDSSAEVEPRPGQSAQGRSSAEVEPRLGQSAQGRSSAEVEPRPRPVLVYGLSGRVIEWVRRTSTVTQAITARDIGAAVASLLAEHGYQQVGVAEPDVFPATILARLRDWTDASQVLTALRLDQAEGNLRDAAQRLCEDAFARVHPGQSQWQAAAAFHGSARLSGAEDVSLLIGEPPAWPGLPREGRLPHWAWLLGRVEYKGAWHQAARSLGISARPHWFSELAQRVRPGARVGDLHVLDLGGAAPFRRLSAEAVLETGAVVALTATRDSELWGETLRLPEID